MIQYVYKIIIITLSLSLYFSYFSSFFLYRLCISMYIYI